MPKDVSGPSIGAPAPAPAPPASLEQTLLPEGPPRPSATGKLSGNGREPVAGFFDKIIQGYNNPTYTKPPPKPITLSPPPNTLTGSAKKMMTNIGLVDMFDKTKLPWTNMVLIIVAIGCIVMSVVLSIYYFMLLFIKVIIEEGIVKLKSPLNSETTDFIAIQSLTFGAGPFNYMYFIILPMVALGCIVALLFYRITWTDIPLPIEMKKFLFLLAIVTGIVLLVQNVIYQRSKVSIRAVEKRLESFNKYVCTKIYKSIKFLENISEPLGSIIAVNDAVRRSMVQLDGTLESVQLAQAFYTITMFNHFQKIGLRNPRIFDAFDLFKPASLLNAKCNPGSYLTRYGTYVEDIAESIIRPNLTPELRDDPIKVDEALQLCNEWITNTNSYANTLYPEDAFNSFMIMVILTFFIQTFIPLYCISAFYSGGTEEPTNIFGRMLNKLVILLI